ncbi:MAG: PrgI family protein [Actinomycetota bacterium]|nr:PrgI family protein [Actinomycetota bacterium]
MSDHDPATGYEPVRIPADVDRDDKILGELTARQAAILAAAAAGLWLAWTATRHLVPPAVFAAAAAPVALAAVVLALGRRDGLSLDRLAAAALRHARQPRRLVPAPGGVHPPPPWADPRLAAAAGPLPAPLRLPATAVAADGTISLGGDGYVAVAAASTVNFALRTPAEQHALTAGFGRWLNSLRSPVQILIRAQRVDLSAMAAAVREAAPGLPHPALEAAALDHAGFLGQLAAGRDLLARQVLIAVREPSAGAAAATIAAAARALAAAGVTVTVLDGGQAAAVLAGCCDPGRPPARPGTALPGQVITAAPRDGSTR